ncbi:glycine betaine ABC transporter substrate-binding protein [Metabacillus herbersteinensis]|uniref:Glycine betaine ABC transporter substrate-binding protein n=1 Tax=Metabacillus herbersteinensis TaxID=283816 RepID=A0ABV6GAS1_9BACI
MKKRYIMVSIVLIFSLMISACGNAANNEGESNKEIEMGMVNWIDNISVANLWKVLLEEKGYTVNLKELDKAAMWTGLSQGDVDLSAQVWLPQTDKVLYEKYKDEIDFGDKWYEGTRLGLVVPAYMKDINSIEDLPSSKDELGSEIVGIDPGSSLMQLTEDVVKQYNLSDYTLVEASESAMLVELKKAYEKQEPIVVTLWNPHWIFAEMDLKYLEDPNKMYGDPDNIQFMTRKDFASDHQEIVDWMNTWEMNDDQLSSLIKYVDEASNPEDGAKKWIDENRELVDSWMIK